MHTNAPASRHRHVRHRRGVAERVAAVVATLAVTVVASLGLAPGGVARAAGGTTFYVAQGGFPAGCTAAEPCPTVAGALSLAGPGDTILIDGTVDGVDLSVTTSKGTAADPLTVAQWPGKRPGVIDAHTQGRIFQVDTGAGLVIDGLTLRNGRASDGTTATCDGCVSAAGSGGGAIHNEGDLTITDSNLIDNTAGDGGDGTEGDPRDGVVVAGKGGAGGAVFNAGTLTIDGSSMRGNTAGNSGDGIVSPSGGDGGAISNTGALTITASVIADNAVGRTGKGGNLDGEAGAIANDGWRRSTHRRSRTTTRGGPAEGSVEPTERSGTGVT